VLYRRKNDKVIQHEIAIRRAVRTAVGTAVGTSTAAAVGASQVTSSGSAAGLSTSTSTSSAASHGPSGPSHLALSVVLLDVLSGGRRLDPDQARRIMDVLAPGYTGILDAIERSQRGL
jgi:hypothetical protein